MVLVAELPKIVFAAVMLAWIVFIAAFLFGKRPKAAVTPDRKREPNSMVGIALQGVAYLVVWITPRPIFSFFVSFPDWAEFLWAAFTIAIAAGSVWLAVAAVRTLGKEWSLTARVVEDHRLVQTGPYRLVRHPIYTGMLGMLVATGSAYGNKFALVLACALMGVGTFIRIKFEERLLRETFGQKFDEYAQRVPAILPVSFWSTREMGVREER